MNQNKQKAEKASVGKVGVERMVMRLNEAEDRIKELEDMLFALGAMNKAPCFVCGYKGPNYYKPNIHSCAKRHHKLFIE